MSWARLRLRLGLLVGALALALVALAGLDLAFPPPLERGREVSVVVADRRGAPLRAFPIAQGRWRLEADLDRTDPAFLAALLAVEDKRFWSHWGVDPAALLRAAGSALTAGRVVSGGSTITMQTARLLEPRPRNLGSKLVEMARALQIERRLSKREILELYLTLAPYGGNLEGLRAASLAYFGREPERLTPEQIALLIALPQAPEARRPDRRPELARAAAARILDRLAALGLLDADLAREAKAAPAPGRRPFPGLAWQAAERLAGRAKAGGEIRATLDAGLQAELEALARERAFAAGEDVQLALIVVDLAERAVRAAVGSADRGRPGGWMDLLHQPRSPGSTLKPFIYGLAFDDGLAAPGTRIDDLPKRFASYQPENFDRRFHGEVTVAEALQHSLNVPAVLALNAVGPERFAAALSFAGAPPVLPPTGEEGVGLALALGGAGFTVAEIAGLYAALGDGGRARPLAWTEDSAQASPAPVALMSAESAEEVLAILRRAPTPQGRAPAALTSAAPRIAFKTGTSYGFRDAWAAGVGEGLAIVVWMGRADAAPRPGETGRAAALPVLFEAFDRAALRLAAPPSNLARPEPKSPALGALSRFREEVAGPEILFPPDGAQVWADGFGSEARGFVLAARGRAAMAWYVDGAPAPKDAAGAAIWRPQGPGFYVIKAVDAQGRSASVRVRALGAASVKSPAAPSPPQGD